MCFIGSQPLSVTFLPKWDAPVKMALDEKPYFEISTSLEINKSVITYWKQRFIEQGIEGLKLGYQGAKHLLRTDERQEIIQWLETKNYWNLDELVTYIDVNYGVVYQSKQSYYDLFYEAGISWKKTEKTNPKSDPETVKKKEKRFRNSSKQTMPKLNQVS
jgi:putative transposase